MAETARTLTGSAHPLAPASTSQARHRLAQARRDFIAELDRSIAKMTALRASLLVLERSSQDWAQSGHSSFDAWRAESSGIGLRTARAQMGVAQTLDDAPEVREAVSSGEVTVVHAEVLARVRSRAARSGSGGLTQEEDGQLLAIARHEDADTFERSADRWFAGRDSLAHDASHEEVRRRRYLTISETARGTHLKGFLDPVAGRTLRVALEAATARPGSSDDRDLGQRSADALVDLASAALSAGDLKNGALVRPHVSVIMSEETFARARTELARRREVGETGTASGGRRGADNCDGDTATRGGAHSMAAPDAPRLSPPAPPLTPLLAPVVAPVVDPPLAPPPAPVVAPPCAPPRAPATFEDGTPVPLTEVVRLLCDADITRIVVDARDEPLNLGRTARLYTREQRRAIIARDRSCRFEGCGRAARWCEVHHVDWWDRDHGETSVTNGLLLCSFHHHEVHRRNLQVVGGEVRVVAGQVRVVEGTQRDAGADMHGPLSRVVDK